MKYFGLPWNPHIAEMEEIPTPLGEKCAWCDEYFVQGDDGLLIPGAGCADGKYHPDCFLRGIVGSLAHQQKRCSCYGGTHEDDPAVSKRQAATDAVEYFNHHGKNF